MSVRLAFEALKNTRDLGGMRTMDGHTIRPGLLIRSGNLAPATEGDLARFGTMVDTTADFRTDKERAEHPDPEIPGVRFIHLPIIDSLSAGVTRDADSDEAAMRILMQSGEAAREYMRNTYRQFAESPAALNGYAAFVRLLAGDRDRALLWHCTAGKDRAGFASILVEELLGVDPADIREDYLYTNVCLAEDIEVLTEMAQREYGMRSPEAEAALRAMFSADLSYLDAVYERIRALWGDFGGYLRDGLGVTEDMIGTIRRRYLV